MKTAGTSIEEAIRKLRPLGSKDIYTGLTHLGDQVDGEDYSQNTVLNIGTLQEHSTPEVVQTLFREEWENYEHFSMVRNPFDLMVSYYWYCYNHPGRNPPLKKCIPQPGEPFQITKKRFAAFLTIPDRYTVLYHHKKLEPFLPTFGLSLVNSEMAKVNSIIRFEHMVSDLTKYFGYDGSWEIPRFKTGFRRDKRPYQEYYGSSNELIDLVYSSFEDIFERFDYKFGG